MEQPPSAAPALALHLRRAKVRNYIPPERAALAQERNQKAVRFIRSFVLYAETGSEASGESAGRT